MDAECPEGVHQMGVGLRRLRTALAIFSDLTEADPHIKSVKNNLKWITSELGPARDFDVYLRKTVTPLDKRKHPPLGANTLNRVTERQRMAP